MGIISLGVYQTIVPLGSCYETPLLFSGIELLNCKLYSITPNHLSVYVCTSFFSYTSTMTPNFPAFCDMIATGYS